MRGMKIFSDEEDEAGVSPVPENFTRKQIVYQSALVDLLKQA